MLNDREKNLPLDDVVRSLAGSRLRFTLIQPGAPARFERDVERVVKKERMPPAMAEYYGIRMHKAVDARFHLWKDLVIFFDPNTKEWIGYEDDPYTAHRFVAEVIGWIYNYRDYFDPSSWKPGAIWHDKPLQSFAFDPSSKMDVLGLSISGYNVRAILFKKICNGVWRDPPCTKENVQFIKGRELVKLVDGLLAHGNAQFTLDEMRVIERYREQDQIFNPI